MSSAEYSIQHLQHWKEVLCVGVEAIVYVFIVANWD